MKWPLMGETITYGDRLKMAYFALTAKKFTNGDKVKEFESEWCKWLGARYSLFVSSGSTANFLLVAAVKELYGLKAGDKVLLPACTWVTNVSPIIQLGLEPIFCDINLKNYSFDTSAVRAIAEKHDIKMVFVTHLLGLPAANGILKKIFPKAIIIDDVCESHGALSNVSFSKRRTKVGSHSTGATFSFYFGHHMSTIEGGMISTNNKKLYDIMKMKRSHGMARESIHFNRYAKEYSDVDKQFLFMTDGYNFRNHEICAVLGLSQLKRLDSMIVKRKENYKTFCKIVNKYSDLFESAIYDDYNSSFCLPFVCKSKRIMLDLKKLFKNNNIEYRPIVSGNLLRQPFLKDYKLFPSNNGASSIIDLVHDQGIYIGNNQFVTSNQLTNLDTILKEYYDSRKNRRTN